MVEAGEGSTTMDPVPAHLPSYGSIILLLIIWCTDRAIPTLKPMIQSLFPACAVYAAMVPGQFFPFVIILISCLFVLFWQRNPELVRDVVDAWVYHCYSFVCFVNAYMMGSDT
jgi:hypothetical protein